MFYTWKSFNNLVSVPTALYCALCEIITPRSIDLAAALDALFWDSALHGAALESALVQFARDHALDRAAGVCPLCDGSQWVPRQEIINEVATATAMHVCPLCCADVQCAGDGAVPELPL